MAQITAGLVKELREKTGAGMMDCKKALTETDGDMEAAVDWLRKKGLAAAAKKAGRVASEGLVAVAVDGTAAAVVEVNAETDFVARNDQFQDMVEAIAGVALANGGDLDKTKAAGYPGSDKNVEEFVQEMVGTIGENMHLRRSAGLSVSNGVVSAYIHNAMKPGMGKIGVLVALESDADKGTLEELGKQLAMHVAAASPLALNRDDVDASELEREKTVLADQARASGKPEEIIEKMVEGRLRKYYEEVVLLEQVFVIDTDKKIQAVVDEAAKQAGSEIKLTGFVRIALGEGVEKKDEDFAAEVAAAVGG